jgi:centromeric protein E
MATSRTYSVPSTPTTRTSRLGQFTPKRTPSTDLSQSSLNARLARVNQPVLLNVTTTKKYKAPLSAEVRKLSNKPKTVLSPVLGSPTKRDGLTSRPRTPVSPSLKPATSEMDVSNVDPELVLVDSQTVEPGDVSGEIDESALDFVHGKEDKVMVSIR